MLKLIYLNMALKSHHREWSSTQKKMKRMQEMYNNISLGEIHMTVEKVMTKQVITVQEDATIETCAHILSTNRLSGLPVVNDAGKLIGIVTEGDLIRRKTDVQTPAYLEFLGGIIYLDNPNKFFEDVKKTMGLYVHEIMSTELITIHPDDTVEKAANLLVHHKIKRLPVLDDEDQLIGIVARKDIMQYLFQDK